MRARAMSKRDLKESYDICNKENILLRWVLRDVMSGKPFDLETSAVEHFPVGDGKYESQVYHIKGNRFLSASGGYLLVTSDNGHQEVRYLDSFLEDLRKERLPSHMREPVNRADYVRHELMKAEIAKCQK